jgi:hypothetical protein
VTLTIARLQVSQLLPLQVLWDPIHGKLSFLPDGFQSQIMCKVYTVVSLGVCQPFLLFLAAALCRFAVRCAHCIHLGLERFQNIQTSLHSPKHSTLTCCCLHTLSDSLSRSSAFVINAWQLPTLSPPCTVYVAQSTSSEHHSLVGKVLLRSGSVRGP